MTLSLNQSHEISSEGAASDGAGAAVSTVESSVVLAGPFGRSKDGAQVSLAEMIVRDFGPETPRSGYEEELDLLGLRAEFLADDGSEGVEWELEDGSLVRHSEIDGWSAEVD